MTIDTTRTSIPPHLVEACRDIASVCRKHNLRNVYGTLRPEAFDAWRHDVIFHWEQGRHGEDRDKLRIESTVVVRTAVDPPRE